MEPSWLLFNLRTRAHHTSTQNSIRERKSILVRVHYCFASTNAAPRVWSGDECSLDAHYVLATTQHSLTHHFDFWDFEGGDGIESGWCFCSFDWSFWILPWPLISCLVWSLTQLKTKQQLSWGHHVSTSKFSTKLTSFRSIDLRLLKWCWK